MFESIRLDTNNDLMAMMKAIKADPRPNKIDLVIGVYKDAAGNVPIMQAVQQAQHIMLETETTKNYVGVGGNPEYCDLVPGVLLGENNSATRAGRVGSLQTPGGAGAIRAAFDFLNTLAPGKTLWVSTPTWGNHIPVARAAGLTVAQYPYFRPSDRGLDFEAMMGHLSKHATAGDAILLHACCHNPTGVDLTFEQWQAVTEFVSEYGLIPVVDCAYQGLGKGLQEDATGLRHMAEKLPEMLIANSFSKNFGIYRERTGALTVLAKTPAGLTKAMGQIEKVIRCIYSMPPSHGARIVTTVLKSPQLTQTWQSELSQMRDRIVGLRHSFQSCLQSRCPNVDLRFLTNQLGMFSYTGLSEGAVDQLKKESGIYIAADGRMNVAGLQDTMLDEIADNFARVLS